MTIDDLIKILQASIAPVVLISGVGLLLLTMTNRLGRTIDRIRQLCAEYEKSVNQDNKAIKEQIGILYLRCRYLRASIVLATSCMFFVSVVIFALFSVYVFHLNLILAVEVLFGAGLAALVLSLVFFLLDIGASLHSVRIEIHNTFGDKL